MNPFKRNILFSLLAGIYMMPEGTGTTAISDETLLDLDSVQALDFDTIEDAPGFETPADGIYVVNVDKACIEAYKTKERDGKPSEDRKRFAHYYSIVEVKELANSKDQAPAVGSKFSERFMMNSKGITYWKSKAKDILGDIGKGVSVANVLKELSNGTYQIVVRIVNKTSKGDDGKTYTNTNVRVIKKAQDAALPV